MAMPPQFATFIKFPVIFSEIYSYKQVKPNKDKMIGVLKSGAKKTGHFQKFVINKKSTIFVQSSCNLVKMIATWANYFHQVSSGLEKMWIFY